MYNSPENLLSRESDQAAARDLPPLPPRSDALTLPTSASVLSAQPVNLSRLTRLHTPLTPLNTG